MVWITLIGVMVTAKCLMPNNVSKGEVRKYALHNCFENENAKNE